MIKVVHCIPFWGSLNAIKKGIHLGFYLFFFGRLLFDKNRVATYAYVLKL